MLSIPREMESLALFMVQQFPVLALMGPRQSGKTHFVQHLFPNKPYINLEDPAVLREIQEDPHAFIKQYPDGAIIDEVQRFPALLSYIQVAVDARQKPGLFILTGSHQLLLHEAITQSLAGRTALLTLLPLSMTEMKSDLSLYTQILKGFYPRLYTQEGINPALFYQFYFQTYVERDVRMLINLKDLSTFQNFMRLCAGRIGQLMNLHSLASDLGVSANTIKHWLSILEASFVLFRLPPYFENFGKRFIKSSKYYFVDVGLACYLLGIETEQQLSRDPLRGPLFENLIILELLKARLNRGKDPSLYFYRDSEQHEIDVIFKQAHDLIPIEIKSGSTFHPDFLKNIDYFRKLTKNRVPRSYLVSSNENQSIIRDTTLLPYAATSTIIVSAQ